MANYWYTGWKSNLISFFTLSLHFHYKTFFTLSKLSLAFSKISKSTALICVILKHCSEKSINNLMGKGAWNFAEWLCWKTCLQAQVLNTTLQPLKENMDCKRGKVLIYFLDLHWFMPNIKPWLIFVPQIFPEWEWAHSECIIGLVNHFLFFFNLKNLRKFSFRISKLLKRLKAELIQSKTLTDDSEKNLADMKRLEFPFEACFIF